jgi:hypothetical protein
MVRPLVPRFRTAVTALFVALTTTAVGAAVEMPDHPPQSIPRRTVVDSLVTAPLDLGRGQPVVEVRLNGKGPFRMYLDTGAGSTVLNDDLARELGLAVIDTTRLGDPVDPQAIKADVVELATIEVGRARFEGVRAVTWDRSTLRPKTPDAPRGVLGIGVFHDVVLSLDYPNQRLRIRNDALPEADGLRVLDYRSPQGIPVIPVRIGGRSYPTHLDSGSPGSFSLPLVEKDSVKLAGEVRETGRGRTANTELVIYGGQLTDTLRIGGHAFPQAEIQFNDRLPHANLGGRVLREFVVTLDQRNRRVRFDRTGRPPKSAVAPKPAPARGTSNAPARKGGS